MKYENHAKANVLIKKIAANEKMMSYLTAEGVRVKVCSAGSDDALYCISLKNAKDQFGADGRALVNNIIVALKKEITDLKKQLEAL